MLLMSTSPSGRSRLAMNLPSVNSETVVAAGTAGTPPNDSAAAKEPTAVPTCVPAAAPAAALDLPEEPEPETEEPESPELASWRRVAVGSGQLRWVEETEILKARKVPKPSCTFDHGGKASSAGSGTHSHHKVSFCSLGSMPATCDLLLAAQRLMDEAYSVCPVVPIHTTYQTSSANRNASTGHQCGGHQRLVLRKAGKGECVSQRSQLAAEAIALGQQAVASLRKACELESALVLEPAVQKTLQSWQERLADFEGARAAPPPRPIEDFNEDWRSEAVLSYCAATHRLRAAMAAVVRMGWAEPVAGETAPLALEKLHTLPTDRGVPGCPAVLCAFKQAGMPVPQTWTAFLKPGKRGRQKHIKEFRASPQ